MPQFTSDVELIRLRNGSVVRFQDGKYDAVDEQEAKYLRSNPNVEEVEADEAPSQNVPTEYESLVEEAKSLDIETSGVSKDDLAEQVAAAKAE